MTGAAMQPEHGGFRAVKVTDRIYWVGAIDWRLRDFHGYLTSRGTTYNAYLILADKVTLIDTVKAPFVDEMMTRIGSVIDPGKIDRIVSNHAEMDHSGGLPATIAAVRPDEVIASALGARALEQHFHWGRSVRVVGDGERIDCGGVRLRFLEAKMLHWPDSMFSFCEEEGVLFTNDAFGMHLAGAERFADEVDPQTLRYEAAKYYANILLPFSPLVAKLLAKVPDLNLDLRMIAPDHGPIWRERPEQILELYGHWARQTLTRKAVVTYHTMWRSTELMARAVADGLRAGGASVAVMPLAGCHRSDVVTELLEAGALVVGSPTLNGQIYPKVADLLTYVRGLKPRNLIGAAFGSYGWGGEAVKQLEAALSEMKIEIAAEGLRVQYVPDREALESCHRFGGQLAARLLERVEA